MEDIPHQSPERQPSEEDLEALRRAIARVGIGAARETLELVATELTENNSTGECLPVVGVPDVYQGRSSSPVDLDDEGELDNFDTSQESERDFEMPKTTIKTGSFDMRENRQSNRVALSGDFSRAKVRNGEADRLATIAARRNRRRKSESARAILKSEPATA